MATKKPVKKTVTMEVVTALNDKALVKDMYNLLYNYVKWNEETDTAIYTVSKVRVTK